MTVIGSSVIHHQRIGLGHAIDTNIKLAVHAWHTMGNFINRVKPWLNHTRSAPWARPMGGAYHNIWYFKAGELRFVR